MKKSLTIVLLTGVCGCISQGRRGEADPISQPPNETPGQEAGGALPANSCLPVVNWEEAISGIDNNRILSQIFSHPSDPEAQRLVGLAKEGKANCPSP